MKNIKYIIYFILFLFILINDRVSAQSEDFCATKSDVPDLLQTIQNQFKIAENFYVVRIFIHIMQKSDGTEGQTQQEVNTALNILVSDYKQHNICFSLLGIDKIKNDIYYNQTNFTSDNNGDGKFDNFSVNSHFNAIDIYLFANDKLFFGLASNIPGTALVIGGNAYGSNLASSHVLSHEVGHCIGLFHTFHGLCESGYAELVNGSNCTTCGDFVCDTPADPKKFNVDKNTCKWTGTTCGGSSTDANGNSYNPNNNLIMAYIPPSCMQYHTTGQGFRMRSIIANSSLLQNILVPDDLVLINLTVNLGQDILYDVRKNLIVQDNVSVESGGKLTLRTGNEIILLPGFEAKEGSEFHAYIDNQCSTIDQNNSAKIDNLNDRNSDTRKPHIKIDTSIVSNEFNLKVYPNPSSGEIKVQYSLLNISTITISVYDNLGSEISSVLQDRLQTKGEYIIPISLDDKSNGLFLCVIEITDIKSGHTKRFQQKLVKIE